MICQECNQRPATLHFTNFSNGEKTELHLCEQCAHEKGEMFMMNQGHGFSLNNLLAGLLHIEPALQSSAQGHFHQDEVLQCPHCHMMYPQFVKIGRFGCAHCYDTFREQLVPIIRRLHSGNSVHSGKIPKRIGGTISMQRNLSSLKEKMGDLIAKEEFEQAAELRDEIRALEKRLAEQSKGGE
ncbi:UvrB/UvrC motif-containing protein [Bacillus massilinigeriensis]|uniref:UvrB/UvrC motif-containing protein n=1 Tax=Bacillus mediterraneensis TaxID=1805474 RepID=UPI0008F80C65|nr:UvrB/UvrC motif-containing protein [Bacillus mediterraneensis]